MESISRSLDAMAESWMGRMDDSQKLEIEVILDGAKAFVLEEIEIYQFGRLSSAKARTMALLSTPKEDPRREALLLAIDALLDVQGFVFTQSGLWTPEEMRSAGMRFHSEARP